MQRLVRGPASVSQLAEPLDMSLPAVVQHLSVLESAGIVSSEKVGRVRTCKIEPDVLRSAETWLGSQRTSWDRRLDRLGGELARNARRNRSDRTTTTIPRAKRTTARRERSERQKEDQK